MKEFQLFKFVNNPVTLAIRVVAFLTLMFLIFVTSGTTQNIVLYLYTFIIMNELYIHLKINGTHPQNTVWNTQNPQEALDWRVRSQLESPHTEKYIRALSKKHPQQFFQEKIGAHVPRFTKVATEKLLHQSLLLARSANGTYITESDIFAAYITLQEPETRLLQDKKITTDDVPYVLFWTRKKYPPRIERRDDIPFAGSGVFDFFVYGWNAELRKYAYDFTLQSIKWGASSHAIGRANEYDLLVKSLLKGKNNNTLLVGNPGVGKTSLVAFFAKESYNARIPGHLSRARIFALQLDRLLSGASTQGELEERVSLLLEEIAHSGNVVVYMPNIELLFGGGGADVDLSGILYDYLKSSRIQIIGTTTPEEYETVIKTHATHAGLFEEIRMREPDEREARFMMFESITHLESAYNVSFSYSALRTAIQYADDYQTNLALPGSAMVLLEDVATDAHMQGIKEISENEVLEVVQRKTNILLSDPTQDEKNTLLHLEDVLHQNVVGQDAAISSVAGAMRRLRSGFKDKNKPIASFLFLGPTGVGKTQTAKTLAASYFGAEENMIRLDMSEYNTPDASKKLLGELPGEEYVDSLIAKVKEQPFALVLLDEFEKSDARVQDLFLQILDDARLTNNRGETSSFENTIIIATSNAGSEYIREHIQDTDLEGSLQNHVLEKGIFKPELLNRFSEVVVFTPLTKEEILQIVTLDLKDTLRKMQDNGIEIRVDTSAVKKIADEGYDAQFGARGAKRYIEKNIESLIATGKLEGGLQSGRQYTLTLDTGGDFIIQ